MINKQTKSNLIADISSDISSNKSLNVDSSLKKIPMIFYKKKNKLNLKPLQYVFNDTGQTRHYPPGAQEWFNSIYTYNKNEIKTLPVADKTLITLLASYFNMNINHKVLNKNTGKKVLRIKRNRFKRLSPRKAFVGRGDLKHTNSKVIITVYRYNIEKVLLLKKVRNLLKYMFLSKSISSLVYTWSKLKNDWLVSTNRPYTLKEFTEANAETIVRFGKRPLKIVKNIDKVVTWRGSYIYNHITQADSWLKTLKKINNYPQHIRELMDKKIIKNKEILPMFKNKVLKLVLPYKTGFKKLNDSFVKLVWDNKSELRRSLLLLFFSVDKTSPGVLARLVNMVERMYNKKVEFNIIDLNQIHLNSDIFTQAVALKLKNRKNSLYRVLRASLKRVQVPFMSRIMEKHYEFNKHDLLENKLRNSHINAMFDRTTNADFLNELLLKFYPSSEKLEIDFKDKKENIKIPVSLEIYLLRTLKNIILRGVRVEAKGRLTKRFTASRSVFKLRWKGGLKNLDSSFKKLSTVMLRNLIKSNVQYSQFSSKNRNGAFGVKGWIGSK